MEINQPTQEVSSHGSPDEQVQSQSQQQPRSYECNFCKKGFSNAQALGGHMNIHRKDKAKLKQASKETRRLMDISTLTPSRTTKPLDITTGQVKSNAKWPCIYSSDDLHESSYPSKRDHESHVSELKQLPLFVETASRNDYFNPIIHASENWQEELHSSHGSFGAELDLELRLGHEPPKSSVAMCTRKFF